MDELIDKPQRSEDELRRALEHIMRQVKETEDQKREAAKNYNERLKDLRAERDAILEQLGE